MRSNPRQTTVLDSQLSTTHFVCNSVTSKPTAMNNPNKHEGYRSEQTNQKNNSPCIKSRSYLMKLVILGYLRLTHLALVSRRSSNSCSSNTTSVTPSDLRLSSTLFYGTTFIQNLKSQGTIPIDLKMSTTYLQSSVNSSLGPNLPQLQSLLIETLQDSQVLLDFSRRI